MLKLAVSIIFQYACFYETKDFNKIYLTMTTSEKAYEFALYVYPISSSSSPSDTGLLQSLVRNKFGFFFLMVLLVGFHIAWQCPFPLQALDQQPEITKYSVGHSQSVH